MNHTLRLTAPRTTDFVRVEAETLSDAACNFLTQHLDKALFVRPAQGHGETSYFAVVEIQGEGAVVARYLFGGIGRKGGLKHPRNPLERDSVAEVERELGMDPGDLMAGEWEGEESIDAAWERKMGRHMAVAA